MSALRINKFLNGLLSISVFSIVFLESNISNSLGFGNSVMTVAYAPFSVYLIIKIFQGGFKKSPNRNYYLLIVILGLTCFVFEKAFGQDYFKVCLQYFILPLLLACCLDTANPQEIRIIRNIVLLLLFVEIGLAIYERMTLSVVFADESSYIMMRNNEAWTFRSSALYGHPLSNALIVMTIILFMLMSEMTLNKKLLIWAYSMLGLLCFNERGNILITTICSFALLTYQYRNFTHKQKKAFIFLIIVICSVFAYYLQTTDIGGRLMFNENSMSDDSDARFAAFGVFGFLSNDELLWGSLDSYDKLLVSMNLAGIENGFIAILLKYGLIFGIPTIILFTIMQIRLLKTYPFFVLITIFLAFNAVAFTNPHISNSRPWLIYLVAYYAFRPISSFVKYDKTL